MKSDYQIFIITRLRKLREEHGYSQKDLAAFLGISNGQMGNIESPRAANKYTIKQIFLICSEFKYPIEQIFLENEDFEKRKDIISLLMTHIIRYGEK